jgi:hypothetical protein
MSLSTVVLVQRFVRRLKVRSAFDRLILRVCADRGVSADVAHVIGAMIFRRPPMLDLDAPMRDEDEQRFSQACGRKKLNHWYRPTETRMSLSRGWEASRGVPYGTKRSRYWADEEVDLVGQMSIPLPFDIYQAAERHYYGEYDYLDDDYAKECHNNCDINRYLLDDNYDILPAKHFFGLWMKDMAEFLPRGGDCTESLENLLHSHRYI